MDAAPASTDAAGSDFDGASMASQHVAKPHTCNMCNTSFVFYSHLAYIDKTTKQFASGFRSLVETGDEVVLACWFCCGQLHGKTYGRAQSDGKVKLTSEWSNKSKGTKPCAISNKKLTRVMAGLEQKHCWICR